MNKWKAAAVIGAAAALSAALVLKKRPSDQAAPAAKPQAGKKAPVNMASGSYSFVSGFKDAKTVEVTVGYDADKFSFAVVEDDFLTYSGDSHVAVIYGEDFNMQLEYASYYQGEGFDAMAAQTREKFGAVEEILCGGNKAIRYLTGDSVCVCISIPDDSFSYLLVTVLKVKGNDDELSEVAVYPELTDILDSVSAK